MQKKTYKIMDTLFCLKDDLTIEESEMVQNLLGEFDSERDGCSSGIIPNGGIRKFLSMILEPSEPGCQVTDCDYGKAKESVVQEIIKDFFLRRVKLTASMADYFKGLMKEFNLQPLN